MNLLNEVSKLQEVELPKSVRKSPNRLTEIYLSSQKPIQSCRVQKQRHTEKVSKLPRINRQTDCMIKRQNTVIGSMEAYSERFDTIRKKHQQKHRNSDKLNYSGHSLIDCSVANSNHSSSYRVNQKKCIPVALKQFGSIKGDMSTNMAYISERMGLIELEPRKSQKKMITRLKGQQREFSVTQELKIVLHEPAVSTKCRNQLTSIENTQRSSVGKEVTYSQGNSYHPKPILLGCHQMNSYSLGQENLSSMHAERSSQMHSMRVGSNAVLNPRLSYGNDPIELEKYIRQLKRMERMSAKNLHRMVEYGTQLVVINLSKEINNLRV